MAVVVRRGVAGSHQQAAIAVKGYEKSFGKVSRIASLSALIRLSDFQGLELRARRSL